MNFAKNEHFCHIKFSFLASGVGLPLTPLKKLRKLNYIGGVNMRVRCIESYYDLELKRNVKAGDEYEVTEERAKELSSTDNKAKRILVEVLEKSTTPTTEKKRGRAKKKEV